MKHFVICQNPGCRFVLDLRINGKSLDSPQPVKKCPACGANWSSICPSCDQALIMKLIDGLPYPACCGQKLRAKAQAA
jgi:hypothetical protein